MTAAFAPTQLFARTAGVLLAGGRSLRFGSEKAVAQLRERALMDWVADKFAPFAAFAVSAPPESSAARHATVLGAPVLVDDPDLPNGPLNGVHAGLAWASACGFEFLATAPCDAPFIADTVYPALLAGIGEARASFAVVGNDEHPLCAVWRTDMQPALRAILADAEHPPVRAVLAQLGARRVAFDDARSFSNANTRAALADLERFG